MKKTLAALCLAFVSIFVWVESAEAARFGGGRSSGMQRNTITRQATPPAQPVQRATPNPNQVNPAAAQPKRSWMGPIAGLAAGLGLAALMSHLGLGEEFANILLIALLAIGAIFIFRLLFRRANAPAAGTNPGQGMGGARPQFAGAANTDTSAPRNEPTDSFAAQRTAVEETTQSSSFNAAPVSAFNAPSGFDSETFLRVAKSNFIRLQAAYDEGNMADIREFTTPEMFAEISLQLSERGTTPQQTDVVTLNAELLDVTTENERHVASVRFNGMIRESNDSGATAFDEVWHLTKPVDGNHGWCVAGIQQAT